MKALAIVATILEVIAVLAGLAMAYVGIFTHSATLGNAAVLTIFVALLGGLGVGALWIEADA